MTTDRLFYQKGNFRNCYDLYYTDDNFKTSTKVSAINPQMADYRWGRAELSTGTPTTAHRSRALSSFLTE